jgi:phage shock protein C
VSKRLYRSRTEKVISGICGGLGEYFDVDSTIIRVLWAVSFFMGGAGLLAYIVAAVIIPEREGHQSAADTSDSEHGYTSLDARDRSRWFGLFLVVLGIGFLIHNWFAWIDFAKIWPLLLVIVGGAIFYRGMRG